MMIFENLKFSTTGFSPRRVAYCAAALAFVTIPLQFADNWRVGAATCCFSVFVVLASSILCFMQPHDTPKRFHPVAWSLIAVIANILCTHL
jgi:hypothetical protein